MRRPLGCLSGVGLIAALATLLVVGVVTATAGGGWFSPGALSAAADGETYGGVRSHAEIGGDCTLCHAPPWSSETMASRCTACHTDLRETGSHLAEFHRLLQGEGALAACRTCHPEHRGAEAALTDMSVEDFPHDDTGYSLAVHPETTAGHPFTCADCHGASFTAFETATCDTCHGEMDAAYMANHRGDFGTACLDCHDGVDRYAGFDHAATPFKLEGGHGAVQCAECHTARNPGQFAEAPVECVGCHEEPDYHRGVFTGACDACHGTDSWQPARYDEPHTFPIEHGESGPSTCRTCHPDALAEYTCYGCHEHTPADIREEHVEEGISDFADCMECHPTGQKEEGEGDHDD